MMTIIYYTKTINIPERIHENLTCYMCGHKGEDVKWMDNLELGDHPICIECKKMIIYSYENEYELTEEEWLERTKEANL